MELKFNSDTKHRKQWFTGLSFSHPAKMSLPLQIWIIENYTKEGEVILDPMAGSGTAMVGCSMGRDVIVIDLEQKFVDMMNSNWEKIRQRGSQLGYSMGKCQIIQGDARNLEGVLADKVVFSPPFSEQGADQVSKYFPRKHRGTIKPSEFSKTNIQNLPYGAIDKIVSSPPFQAQKTGGNQGAGKYSGTDLTQGLNRVKDDYSGAEDPNNIGKLSYGEIDKIITSPPYEGSEKGNEGPIKRIQRNPNHPRMKALARQLEQKGSAGGSFAFGYPSSDNNIGNLKSDTYLEAMLQVYQQCFSVLKIGGLMVLVVKNFIRNKQVIRLDTDTIKLCEQAGFTFKERHYRKLMAQSFWRVTYHKKFPDVEQIDKEDVLVFRR